MYDVILLEELKKFKKGTGNIHEQDFFRDNIRKIINNRTKDKIYLLDLLLEKNLIDKTQYNKFMKITKNDYKVGHLCVLGLISVFDLE